MTQDEANTVAKLIGFADSACDNCVSELVEVANRLFPKYKWTKTDGRGSYEYRLDWQAPEDEPFNDRYIIVTAEPRP